MQKHIGPVNLNYRNYHVCFMVTNKVPFIYQNNLVLVWKVQYLLLERTNKLRYCISLLCMILCRICLHTDSIYYLTNWNEQLNCSIEWSLMIPVYNKDMISVWTSTHLWMEWATSWSGVLLLYKLNTTLLLHPASDTAIPTIITTATLPSDTLCTHGNNPVIFKVQVKDSLCNVQKYD